MAKVLFMLLAVLVVGVAVLCLLMMAVKFFLQLRDEYLLELRKAERDAREAVDDLDYEIDRTTSAARRRRARRAAKK